MKKLILFILLIISTSIGGSEESYKMEITLKLEGITIKQADDLLTQCTKLKPKPVVTYSLKGNKFRQ